MPICPELVSIWGSRSKDAADSIKQFAPNSVYIKSFDIFLKERKTFKIHL